MAYKPYRPTSQPLQEELRLRINGLYTNPNMFSEVPEGALLAANNIVIDRESIASTRRGFAPYGIAVNVTGVVQSLFNYNDTIIAWTNDHKLYYDASNDGSTWTQYTGTFLEPDTTATGSRIRSVESNKNFFFTSADGVYKLDSISGTPSLAGAPAGLGGYGSTTGVSGFMSDSTNVAYRIVWGYKDANDNLILGAPSDRIIVSNSSGGTRDVSLSFLIPPGGEIDSTWFYQVYRSDESASLSDAPDDELQQVYEDNPTAGELSAGLITITDSTPNDLKQATIYTAPSREGIENANYRPPFAKDVTVYRNMTFYANTRGLHRLYLTLASVAGSVGLNIGDTITFTDSADASTFTLTAAAAEDSAAGEFQIYSGGTPSENIAATAQSIVKILNTYSSNTFLVGYYKSGFDELPGQMLFEKQTLDPDSFSVVSSNVNCWTQIIPTSGTNIYNVSVNDVNVNRVYFSKVQQPEAVPLYRYFDIGSALKPIERIIALRDSVIVLKADGVYRIEGTSDSSLSVTTIDRTISIQAPNSAALFNNRVVFFSEQGVVAVSDLGAEVLSRPIEKLLLSLNADNNVNFKENTFGVGYESDRKYVLSTITAPGDTVCTQQYVYNSLTNTWTRWDRTNSCGIVNSRDDKLYFGGTFDSEAHVYQERKSLTSTDYADDQYNITIVSATDLTVELSNLDDVEVGDTISQGGSSGVVVSIDEGAVTVEVDTLTDWTAGAAILYKPIDVLVKTVQVSGGNPGVMKHIPECSLYFENTDFEALTASFTSDFIASSYSVPVTIDDLGGWGEFAWGLTPWGGDVTGSRRIRVLVPREVQRTNWLTISLENSRAFSSFSLQGISIMFNVQSERQKN